MITLALLCTYCKLSLQQICFYSTDTTWTVSITKLFVYYSKNARKYFAYFFIKKKEIYCNEKKDAKILNMTFNLLKIRTKKNVQNFLKFVHEVISRLSETYNFKTSLYRLMIIWNFKTHRIIFKTA